MHVCVHILYILYMHSLKLNIYNFLNNAQHRSLHMYIHKDMSVYTPMYTHIYTHTQYMYMYTLLFLQEWSGFF